MALSYTSQWQGNRHILPSGAITCPFPLHQAAGSGPSVTLDAASAGHGQDVAQDGKEYGDLRLQGSNSGCPQNADTKQPRLPDGRLALPAAPKGEAQPRREDSWNHVAGPGDTPDNAAAGPSTPVNNTHARGGATASSSHQQAADAAATTVQTTSVQGQALEPQLSFPALHEAQREAGPPPQRGEQGVHGTRAGEGGYDGRGDGTVAVRANSDDNEGDEGNEDGSQSKDDEQKSTCSNCKGAAGGGDTTAAASGTMRLTTRPGGVPVAEAPTGGLAAPEPPRGRPLRSGTGITDAAAAGAIAAAAPARGGTAAQGDSQGGGNGPESSESSGRSGGNGDISDGDTIGSSSGSGSEDDGSSGSDGEEDADNDGQPPGPGAAQPPTGAPSAPPAPASAAPTSASAQHTVRLNKFCLYGKDAICAAFPAEVAAALHSGGAAKERVVLHARPPGEQQLRPFQGQLSVYAGGTVRLNLLGDLFRGLHMVDGDTLLLQRRPRQDSGRAGGSAEGDTVVVAERLQPGAGGSGGGGGGSGEASRKPRQRADEAVGAGNTAGMEEDVAGARRHRRRSNRLSAGDPGGVGAGCAPGAAAQQPPQHPQQQPGSLAGNAQPGDGPGEAVGSVPRGPAAAPVANGPAAAEGAGGSLALSAGGTEPACLPAPPPAGDVGAHVSHNASTHPGLPSPAAGTPTPAAQAAGPLVLHASTQGGAAQCAACITHLHGYMLDPAALPPLQPGQVRVCGLTYDASLAPAVRRMQTAWAERNLQYPYRDPTKHQMVFPGIDGEHTPEAGGGGGGGAAAPPWAQAFRRHGLSRNIISHRLGRLLGLTGEHGRADAPLPEGPVALEGALAACGDVARGGAGAQAEKPLRKHAVLGVVGGYVMPAMEAEAFVASGHRHCPPEAVARLARATAGSSADVGSAWRLLAGAFRMPLPAGAVEPEQGVELPPVELSMLGYGNTLALVNDPRVQPRAWLPGNDVESETADTHANCMVVPIAVRGLVLPVLVALRDIARGEQLLRDYGAAWWRQHADAWEVVEDDGLSVGRLLHGTQEQKEQPPAAPPAAPQQPPQSDPGVAPTVQGAAGADTRVAAAPAQTAVVKPVDGAGGVPPPALPPPAAPAGGHAIVQVDAVIAQQGISPSNRHVSHPAPRGTPAATSQPPHREPAEAPGSRRFIETGGAGARTSGGAGGRPRQHPLPYRVESQRRKRSFSPDNRQDREEHGRRRSYERDREHGGGSAVEDRNKHVEQRWGSGRDAARRDADITRRSRSPRERLPRRRSRSRSRSPRLRPRTHRSVSRSRSPRRSGISPRPTGGVHGPGRDVARGGSPRDRGEQHWHGGRRHEPPVAFLGAPAAERREHWWGNDPAKACALAPYRSPPCEQPLPYRSALGSPRPPHLLPAPAAWAAVPGADRARGNAGHARDGRGGSGSPRKRFPQRHTRHADQQVPMAVNPPGPGRWGAAVDRGAPPPARARSPPVTIQSRGEWAHTRRGQDVPQRGGRSEAPMEGRGCTERRRSRSRSPVPGQGQGGAAPGRAGEISGAGASAGVPDRPAAEGQGALERAAAGSAAACLAPCGPPSGGLLQQAQHQAPGLPDAKAQAWPALGAEPELQQLDAGAPGKAGEHTGPVRSDATQAPALFSDDVLERLFGLKPLQLGAPDLDFDPLQPAAPPAAPEPEQHPTWPPPWPQPQHHPAQPWSGLEAPGVPDTLTGWAPEAVAGGPPGAGQHPDEAAAPGTAVAGSTSPCGDGWEHGDGADASDAGNREGAEEVAYTAAGTLTCFELPVAGGAAASTHGSQLEELVSVLGDALGLEAAVRLQLLTPLGYLGKAALVAAHKLFRCQGLPCSPGAVLQVEDVPVEGLTLRLLAHDGPGAPASWADLRVTASIDALLLDVSEAGEAARRSAASWLVSLLAAPAPCVALQVEHACMLGAVMRGHPVGYRALVPLHAEVDAMYQQLTCKPDECPCRPYRRR